MKKDLEEHLLQHLKASALVDSGDSKLGDKTRHPLFVTCSGAGTGKSRLLDEFHKLCCDVMSEDLSTILKESYVFKVDLSNGII